LTHAADRRRSQQTSIQISAAPDEVFAFVADASRLLISAIGFAKAIEPDGERWR
jgi:hypothetical protein